MPSFVVASPVPSENASSYPAVVQLLLLIVLLLASGVWIGGWVAQIVVAMATTKSMAPADRIQFYKHYGKSYGMISTIALLVALGVGLAFLLALPWTTTSTILVVLSVLLLVLLALGVVQARKLGVLRRQAVNTPDDKGLAAHLRSTSRQATTLRGALGVISVAILIIGVLRVAA